MNLYLPSRRIFETEFWFKIIDLRYKQQKITRETERIVDLILSYFGS